MMRPTHGFDDSGVGEVVDDDLAHLGEVPSIPFLRYQHPLCCSSETGCNPTHLDPHRVDVDLLVEVVEKSDRLDDHGVDLVGGELELEAGEGVSETERHGVDVSLVDAAEQRRELLSDTTVQVLGRRVGKNGDGEGLVDRRCC